MTPFRQLKPEFQKVQNVIAGEVCCTNTDEETLHLFVGMAH